jgi:pimeloyl-ACP methyl ester carboxylesterase
MIAFSKNGKGPHIILIHGFCESKEMWTSFAAELSTNYTVFCPDLPGFGESPINRDHISLEETAQLIQDWMVELGIHHPVVIGHSLGGYVTLALAELMGIDLKAIGLFHSSALPDDGAKKKIRNKTIQFIKKHGVDKFIESFVPPLFSEQHRAENEGKINELIALGKKSAKKGLIAFIAAMRDRKDRMEVWQTFRGPKLMIAGELDSAVKIEASRLHKTHATHYHELIGTGHMGMFEKKEKTSEIIKKFLKDVNE